jgi:hypothetical protein
MNKRQIIASLNKIANQLDSAAFFNEANTVTKVMTKLAQAPSDFMGDFTSKPNIGKNIVNQLSEMIMSKLKGNEEARQHFSGGELQSFVLEILDKSIEDYQEAKKQMVLMLQQYQTGLDESDYKSFNAILNNWKSYKNQQSMEMGL